MGTDNTTLHPISKFSDFAVKILKSVGGERVLTVLTCYSDLHSVYMGRIITAWCPVSNEIRAAGMQVPSLGSCRALWVSGCFMIPYVVKGSLPSFPSQGKGLCTVCQTSLTGTGQFSQEGLSLAILLCLHQ